MKEINQATHVVRYFGNHAHPRGITWYVRDMGDHYSTVDQQHIVLKKCDCQILQTFDAPITNIKIRINEFIDSVQLQAYLFMRGVCWGSGYYPYRVAHVHKRLLFVDYVGVLDYISTEDVFNGVCVPEYTFQTDPIGLPSLTPVELVTPKLNGVLDTHKYNTFSVVDSVDMSTYQINVRY